MASTDFFISYAGADQVWAEWIADTLERAEYRTVLQKWDFRPGENFILRMDRALDEAEESWRSCLPRISAPSGLARNGLRHWPVTAALKTWC
jgi:hypothetical protein